MAKGTTPTNAENEPTFDQKLNAFKDMVILFRYERFLFQALCIIAFVVLMVFACLSYFKPGPQTGSIIAMFGSSGAVGFSCGRLWYQWNDAMELLGLKKNNKKP
jgi:hypothetical protein